MIQKILVLIAIGTFTQLSYAKNDSISEARKILDKKTFKTKCNLDFKFTYSPNGKNLTILANGQTKLSNIDESKNGDQITISASSSLNGRAGTELIEQVLTVELDNDDKPIFITLKTSATLGNSTVDALPNYNCRVLN